MSDRRLAAEFRRASQEMKRTGARTRRSGRDFHRWMHAKGLCTARVCRLPRSRTWPWYTVYRKVVAERKRAGEDSILRLANLEREARKLGIDPSLIRWH